MGVAPTRAAALEALGDFLPRAGRAYAKARNYDFGPATRGNVSNLSPYTRHRIITEQEIVQRVLERHALSSSEKFIQEVCWRTYWKGWLEHRPQLWSHYLDAVEEDRRNLQTDDAMASAYAEAVEGRTGITCFDAWAKELQETGYLHNHARMWFASIWIFTLELPWTLGGDFFYNHLYDGDPASNTLSWRWVGGLQTKGKTYLARSDNIATFTDGRFLQTPQLSGVAEPLEDNLPVLTKTPLQQRNTPLPNTPAILLLHEDDLHPQSLGLDLSDLKGIAFLPADISRLALSEGVLAFKSAAANAALQAASSELDIPAMSEVASIDTVQDHLDTAANLTAFCKSVGAQTIITPEAPVGPSRMALDAVEQCLAANSIALHRIRRDWDNAFWPHAKAGFFKLKEKIPGVLAELGVAR
ncbi:MAG: FAD-binding domain-containing protein [Pseudomonadota bacterium]